MLRRFLLAAILILALPSLAATRWHSERAGAPVKWQEWGRAALDRATKEKRPIFLSISYAASWDGYRMQRDAFTAPQNVETLNAYFIPVLLDRIEHPELAEAYEHTLRVMNGTSGSLANLILTPTLEPFAGGGFLSADELQRLLVTSLSRWNNEQAGAWSEAVSNVAKARESAERRAPMNVDATTIEAVIDDVAKQYEKTKKLDPSAIPFLLRYSTRTKHEPLRSLAIETLRTRAASRMRDQLGGGFFHCDTCFEKLLTDQALMALAYTEAFALTNDPDLRHVAMTTLDYALRDLRFPGTASFEASQDAYSLIPNDGRHINANGVVYEWKREEIAMLTGDSATKIFSLYGIKESAPTIPILSEVRFLKESYNELAAPIAKLTDVRLKRPAPFREPLVVAGWNGLMLSALSRASITFNDADFLNSARQAAAAVTGKLWDAKKSTLARSSAGGVALAEDYALLIAGLLDLFEASQDVRWLDLAITLQQKQDQLFWDASLGRYSTGTTLPETLRGLLIETDTLLPSANAISAVNLMRLASLTPNEAWSSRPAMIFQSHGGRLRSDGARLTELAKAYELSQITPRVVVVTGDIGLESTRELLLTTQQRLEPMRTVVFLPAKGAARDRVVKSLPLLGTIEAGAKEPLTYVCSSGACRKQ